jgi:hypothetical protein
MEVEDAFEKLPKGKCAYHEAMEKGAKAVIQLQFPPTLSYHALISS